MFTINDYKKLIRKKTIFLLDWWLLFQDIISPILNNFFYKWNISKKCKSICLLLFLVSLMCFPLSPLPSHSLSLSPLTLSPSPSLPLSLYPSLPLFFQCQVQSLERMWLKGGGEGGGRICEWVVEREKNLRTKN